MLIEAIREEFASESYSNNARLTVLQSLLRLKLPDESILNDTIRLIKMDKITNINQLTNVLYILAKFKCQSGDYIDFAIQRFAKEPKLEVRIACRNLWNLFALDHKSEAGLKLFADVIQKGDSSKLNELDLANSLRAFAHFQYVNFDCLEMLLKQSIRSASEMKLKSLAVVVNSFAELDVTNPTLLTITKEILLRSVDTKSEHVLKPQDLEPINCA